MTKKLKKTLSKKSKKHLEKKSVHKKITIKDPHFSREKEKYENPIYSREFILDYLAKRGQPATRNQLIDELHLTTDEQREAIRRRLIAMVRDGQLLMNRRNAYGPLDKMELIRGHVMGHKEGYGFLIPEDESGDLFLVPQEMRKVFHGDRVLARASGEKTRGKREAIIVEVLECATQQLVGRFFEEAGACFVEPSHQRITQDILIPKEDSLDAKNGQMVVAAITDFPHKHHRARGKIIEILGDQMAPGMEINVAIYNHALPNHFNEAVMQEAQAFASTLIESDYENRTDLRHLAFCTIDGEDAKDFDDAVYCEPKKNGFQLWVAIADVSHYVKPNSALDNEAYLRGNSVYFPGKVIPMLPETLSNHLCSLKPKQDRLAMVAEMSISNTGKITSSTFYKAVICSKERLTYTSVNEMLEKKNAKIRKQYHAILPHLEHLKDVYAVLRTAREKRGAIDFDLPETKIVFDQHRKIQSIVPYERYLSHRMIEECMLAANISAAQHLIENKQLTLFRVHKSPNPEKIMELKQFLKEMGLPFPARKAPVPLDFSNLLKQLEHRVDAHLIQTVLLRSMSRAVYSPHNEGHFGLAYEAYTHFTSPIRRYPDLLVHRALTSKSAKNHSMTEFERIGEHCSMTERRADDATDEAKTFLKCEFMMDQIGHSFSGVISSVTSFGLFVELNDIFIEGLIHISALPNDYYRFDSIRHSLTGERRNCTFRLGDPIRVQLVRVDLDEQKIDFILDEPVENRKKPSKKRRKKS